MSDLPNAPQIGRAPTRPEVREYLNYEGAELFARRAEILAALERMVAEHPHIADGDDDTAGKFVENRRMAKALVDGAGDRHKKTKEPYRQAGLEVDLWKNEFIEPIEIAIGKINRIALDFSNRKEAIERAKREEAARIAREEADRKAREAAEAMRKASESAEAEAKLNAASKAAEQAARAATKAAAPASEVSRTRGIYGGTMGVRTTWTWQVADIKKLLRAALDAFDKNETPEWINVITVDPDVVRALSADRDPKTRRPLAVIPGIDWVEKRSV